ncbi:DUF2817 domain-containing protein [Shewanella canadensis]|uniref:DUF2817 domain-containing protein n=1 Tax=Shewanella canadensis TaxID=271096 RepID=A0A3S0KUP2_9GAMM|nr:M14 family metallocarboxypeptidase [Shewanella canadensis]RTR38899.1 DUF2817 domain-containing protein [Shewanella canadensis]
MKQLATYSIGIPGNKWAEEEKRLWLLQQEVKRSYQKEVVSKLEPLKERFDVEQYGELSYDAGTYPLFVVRSRQWDSNKATMLVTGGVHGYETSGVQGAIRFIETQAESYSEQFNIIVAPCLSPWGYETINRWNPNAVDPNRSFYENSPSEESAALMRYIAELDLKLTAHIDLHETTDTDNSEFRPALAARDGSVHNNWNIPDGFYLVGDTENPVDEFQQAIIEVVAQVTHIAPPDEEGKLIGVPLSQEGVVNYATKALGLCIGFSDAAFTTTTEVYPDSPRVDDENCILAQVAAITGGLDFILKTG